MRESYVALQRNEAAILGDMDRSPAEQELNRVESELDANETPGGKPPLKLGGGQGDGEKRGKSDNQALDDELVTALMRFVVSAALVFAGRLSLTQRMQLTTGSVGGAVGLLLGYGVGMLKH